MAPLWQNLRYVCNWVPVSSMEVTHSPFLREAQIDSEVSFLKFDTAKNLLKELNSITVLQHLPNLDTRNSQREFKILDCLGCARV